jgi:hypothetical protein
MKKMHLVSTVYRGKLHSAFVIASGNERPKITAEQAKNIFGIRPGADAWAPANTQSWGVELTKYSKH